MRIVTKCHKLLQLLCADVRSTNKITCTNEGPYSPRLGQTENQLKMASEKLCCNEQLGEKVRENRVMMKC